MAISGNIKKVIMKKEFVPYELAVKLKSLGFNEPCLTCYDKLEMVASHSKNVFDYKNYNSSGYIVSRPTFSQAFKWFREKYGLLHDITLNLNTNNELEGFYILIHKLNGLVVNEDDDIELDVKTTNKEEAELACLTKLIEIVESKSE